MSTHKTDSKKDKKEDGGNLLFFSTLVRLELLISSDENK